MKPSSASPVTAASVRPSGEKASPFTSPPVSRSGEPTGLELERVPESDPLPTEAHGDEPAVGAERTRPTVEARRGDLRIVREA